MSFALTSHAQDSTIDSLKRAFTNPKLHDSTKLRALSTIMGSQYTLEDPNYYYLNGMMEKMALKNFKSNAAHPDQQKLYADYLGEVYASSAIGAQRKRDYRSAFIAINKSIAFYKRSKSYELMNFSIVTKGTLYSDIQDYEKALECFFQPLRYFEHAKEENSASGVSYVQTYLGQVYLKQKKYTQSIHYYQKANTYYAKLKQPTAQDLHEQSYIFANIGKCFAALKNSQQAINYFNQSIALAEKIGDVVTTNMVMGMIASIKIEQKKYGEAEQILLANLKAPFQPLMFIGNYKSLAELYLAQKDYVKAESYADKAFALSKEYKQFEMLTAVSGLLYTLSTNTKNYKKALDMHLLNTRLLDSSKMEVARNAMAQQELKYGFEKKALQLKIAAEKEKALRNTGLLVLSSLVVLLLISGYFYYRTTKQKQAISVLEKDQIKQKLMVTQMNPHFIFNSIDNIQGLIYEDKDDEAIDYLTKFSKLTRQILENSNENYISLEEEIEMTLNYLAIQQLLYDNKFEYRLVVEETIDQESIFLPPMLTQPFIENAIKHGLSSSSRNGKINIHFFLQGEKLFFEVTDNGKGFDTSQKVSNHKSLAMTITKERLVSYTKNNQFVVHADNILDHETNVVGAKVSFEIPYIIES